jgi:hypothetical protein
MKLESTLSLASKLIVSTAVLALGCGQADRPAPQQAPPRTSEASALLYPDPGDGGEGRNTAECVFLAGKCIGSIIVAVPACAAACATAGACIACAGAAGLAISECGEWQLKCNSGPQEGDLCTTSYYCERSGLHCVNGECTQRLGVENEGCETDRDCYDGTCLRDVGASRGRCFRLRDVGEVCSSSLECRSNLECRDGTCQTPGASCQICAGQQCGYDLCGSGRWCGFCQSGYACNGVTCEPSCTQCLYRSCGWDYSCGTAYCGTCPQGFDCQDGGCVQVTTCYPCQYMTCGIDTSCGFPYDCGPCGGGGGCSGDSDCGPGESCGSGWICVENDY